MILPSTRFLWCLTALAALAVAVSIYPRLLRLLGDLAGITAVLALLDAVTALRLTTPPAARRCRARSRSACRSTSRCGVHNPSRLPLLCEVHDHHPASVESEAAAAPRPRPGAMGRAAATGRGRCARGEARFGAERVADLLAAAAFPGEAIDRRRRLRCASIRISARSPATPCSPPTTACRRSACCRCARRGEGMEFHQLREYRQGDSQRAIDWKATSRTARLISREYEDEKDQRVLLVVDCGRRMASKDGELSHFDHTLNAALLLAHVGAAPGRRGRHADHGRHQPLLRAAQVDRRGARDHEPHVRRRADARRARLLPRRDRGDAPGAPARARHPAHQPARRGRRRPAAGAAAAAQPPPGGAGVACARRSSRAPSPRGSTASTAP